MFIACCAMIFAARRMCNTDTLRCVRHDPSFVRTSAFSGVVRIWCQERHMQMLQGFTGGNCRHIVAVRLCTGQSALKKLTVVSRGGTCPCAP